MSDPVVRERLDAMIRERGEDYASLSRLLGRNPAYIQQFIRRGVPRRLSEEDRRRLAAHFRVSEQLLGASHHRALSPPADSGEDTAGLVLVPYLDLDASAGPGSTPDGEQPASALAFERGFARGLARAGPQALSAIRVTGDSMLPTLADGDDILVDTSAGAAEPIRDGIYVLRMEGALLVKRLAVHPGTRRVDIVSDNKTYPSFADCDPATISVIGRVVWVGRRLP